MKCEAVRNWILECESLQARTWPKKFVRHVRRCRPCRHFARGLLRIEDGWRNQALPEAAKAPSPAFLKQIEDIENPPLELEPEAVRRKRKSSPAAPSVPARKKTHTPMRWVMAIAAMILVGLGALVYLAVNPPHERHYSPDVVDRLIDWNVKLAVADKKDRPSMLQDFEPKMREELATANLSPEDRQFAERLLADARTLAADDDPVKEEAYIAALDSVLNKRIEEAMKGGDNQAYGRRATQYANFLSANVTPIYSRAFQARLNQGQKPGPKGVETPVTDKKGIEKKGPGLSPPGGFVMTPEEQLRMQQFLQMQMEQRQRMMQMWMQKGRGPTVIQVRKR
jgi:hypothetical protein